LLLGALITRKYQSDATCLKLWGCVQDSAGMTFQNDLLSCALFDRMVLVSQWNPTDGWLKYHAWMLNVETHEQWK
jgi:hypothetical protein